MFVTKAGDIYRSNLKLLSTLNCQSALHHLAKYTHKGVSNMGAKTGENDEIHLLRDAVIAVIDMADC